MALIPPFGFSISTRCGRNILVYLFTITANDSVSLRLSVFVWCIFSSAVIYMIAGLIAFTTLRRHKLGRFYSVMILIMGIMVPLSLGLITSAAIAFVYQNSNFFMGPLHAAMRGVGQTVIHAAVGGQSMH